MLRRLFHDIATLAFNDSTFLFSFSVKHIQRNKFIAKIEVFKMHVLLSIEVHMMCVCACMSVCGGVGVHVPQNGSEVRR